MKSENLGKKIETARALLGMTQADFAKRMNVQQQTVSRWELGTSKPLRNVLEKIMEFFHLQEQERREWQSSANHEDISCSPVSSKLASTVSFSVPIPFSALTAEDFERFSHELLTCLYPTAKIHRYGNSGHKQDGTDIEVRMGEGWYDDFQCKRHKEFGAAKVLKAIQKYTRSGRQKYIILSRIASSGARSEISKYPDWDIWDAEDLSLKTRSLSKEKACKLVDRFFPGQRLALLGIQEAGPWQEADNFFRPYCDRSRFFNHKWALVGQHENLEKIINSVEDENIRIVFLSGVGGSGKSKLLYEFSKIHRERYPHLLLRIALPTEKITGKNIEDLGEDRKILVIEDAHEQENLNSLFQFVAASGLTKIFILTRPYSLESLRSVASKFGLSSNNIATIFINPLSEQQSIDLSTEVLEQFNGPVYLASEIARLTRGCPFATILGGYLVAKKGIYPSALTNEDEFKNEILYRFENIISGEFVSQSDSQLMRSLLELIALIQPFSLDDENFRKLTIEIINPFFDRTAKLIRLLIENNILLKRKNLYYISPDPLTDFIIESSCILNGASTGLAERVFEKISGSQIERMLCNIGKLTWRLSSANKHHGFILDVIWKKLEKLDEDFFATPSEIINAIISVSCYQPEKAMAFADKLVSEKKYLSFVPKILKYVAYNFSYIKPVCRRLWELAVNDLRSIQDYPDHPIKALIDLSRIEYNKPIEYCKPVIEFALSIVEEESAWRNTFTPLDILAPIFLTQIESTRIDGVTVTLSRSEVLHQMVEKLRADVVDKILTLLESDDLKKALHAAKILHQALQYPMLKSDPNNLKNLTSEFVVTLEKIKIYVRNKKIHNIVLIEILRSINWHVNHGMESTKKIANEIIALLPGEIDFRLLRALVDGWGQLWMKEENYSLQQEEWQKEMDSIANILLRENSSAVLIDKLDYNLDFISSVSSVVTSSPHLFINHLSKKSLDFSSQLIQLILESPNSEFIFFAGNVLSVITSKNRSYGLSIAKQFIETNNIYLLRAVAQSCHFSERNNFEFSIEEIDILRTLSFSDDIQVLTPTLYAIEKLGYKNPLKAQELLSNMDFRGDAKIADAILRIFHPNKAVPSNYILDNKIYDKILDKLLPMPALDGHWLEHFLSRASYEQPIIAAEFFMKRVELDNHSYDYRPFNHGVYSNVPLRFHETSVSIFIMEMIRDWMKIKITNDNVKWYGSILFFTIFNPSDQKVSEFLYEWVKNGSQDDFKIVIDILSAESNEFSIDNPDYIISLFQLADKFGREYINYATSRLFGAVVSGIRSGAFGQPYPKDIFLRDESTRILGRLSPISSVYQLYEDIFQCAEESIKRSKKDKEFFLAN